MAEHAALRTVQEVAAELRVSKLTIYRRIQQGDLEAVRIGSGGPIRVSAESVDRLLRPAMGSTSEVVAGRDAANRPAPRPRLPEQGA